MTLCCWSSVSSSTPFKLLLRFIMRFDCLLSCIYHITRNGTNEFAFGLLLLLLLLMLFSLPFCTQFSVHFIKFSFTLHVLIDYELTQSMQVWTWFRKSHFSNSDWVFERICAHESSVNTILALIGKCGFISQQQHHHHYQQYQYRKKVHLIQCVFQCNRLHCLKPVRLDRFNGIAMCFLYYFSIPNTFFFISVFR